MCQNKTRLDSCLQELPQLESPGIPSDKEGVDTACRAFKKGMLCFDQYVNTCINGDDRIVINSNVAGARKAFISLCDDPHFQGEYLRHAPCYRNVSKDWEKCSRRFLEQVRSGPSAKLCCARDAFLECVYDAGTHHCRPESAKFLRQFAEILSSAHFYRTSCHPSTTSSALCASGNLPRPQMSYIVVMIAVLGPTILRVYI
ncbi:uncharacterized protein [Anabrus simplex]